MADINQGLITKARFEQIRRLETTELYAAALDTQARLYAEDSQTFLGVFDHWQKARNILDVGCGPGSSTAILEPLLRNKSYVGVDISPDFVSRAKLRYGSSQHDVAFQCTDVFNFKEKPFDFVTGIAVLQHIPETRSVIQHLRRLMKAGGGAAFFDVGQSRQVQAHPKLPAVDALYAALTKEGSATARQHRCLELLEAEAEELGFQVIAVRDCEILIKDEAAKDDYVNYMYMVSELVARFWDVKSSPDALIEDLTHWRNTPGAHVTLNDARWIVLEAI